MWPFGKRNKWRLKCKYCGEKYTIGDNAFLITEEDLHAARKREGGSVISLGESTREPELVRHWRNDPKSPSIDEVDEKARTKELKKAAQISAAIARGESRTWWCDKCSDMEKINKFPIRWGK